MDRREPHHAGGTTMKKASNGRGSIYFREDRGLYVAQVDMGFVNGKRSRRRVYGKTKREVSDKLAQLQVAQQGGLLPTGDLRMTTGAYLEWWLAQRPQNHTTHGYARWARNHIIPAIGRIPLSKLEATDIDAMLNRLRRELGDQSRKHCRSVLTNALAYAERKNRIPRNVAKLSEEVSVKDYKPIFLDIEQANAFLDAAKDSPLEALYICAIYLGMRQGELLGMLWHNIDLRAGKISILTQLQREAGQPTDEGLVINQHPKWGSERTVGIPTELGAIVLTALREHRRRQVQAQISAGTDWTRTMPLLGDDGKVHRVDNDLVFTTSLGRPISGTHLSNGDFRRVCIAAGIAFGTRGRKGLRFHDLRHSAATIMLAAGVPERVVMEILGHSTTAMIKKYQHVLPGLTVAAAAKMQTIMGRDAMKGAR